jgi:hypothetical protein
LRVSQKNLEDNLIEKKILIEKLKELLITDGSINSKYNEFKKIQNSWIKTGQVPRSQNVIIWNNYQHHIKNFYDYLHLNRKFKEIDLDHNLKEKEKIILNAKELLKNNDQFKAFKDFERLKKRWKFELGPVKKEKEEILNTKRKEFESNKDSILKSNYTKKESLITEIQDLHKIEINSIKNWQEKIKTFDTLKNKIELAGPIPGKFKKTFWNNYKKVTREFYSKKNKFFKNIKNIYSENITKQNLLIEEVKRIINKDGLEKERQNVISIQKKWKLIKPVPYKANEKNWKIFKNTCDTYFQKISQNKNIESKENKEFETKQNQLIEELDKFKGKLNDLEDIIKEYLSINKINSDKEKLFFEKIKNHLIRKGINENESQNKINEMKSKFMSNDQKKSEIYKLNLKLDKLKKDLIQQENNLLFFKDNSKENKLLNTVHLKIKNQKIEIERIINNKKNLLK